MYKIKTVFKAVIISALCLFIYTYAFSQQAASPYKEKGIASYYARSFHGLLTANGEVFNNLDFTAAHKKLPFNTILLVTNLENGKSTVVRVNDRGPYSKNRIIDLSRPAARKLGMMDDGIMKVDIQELNVIKLSPEIIEKFEKNKLLDINGKTASLKKITVKAWESSSLEHVMYMIINLKLTHDLDDIYIQGKGIGKARRYSIVVTNIRSKEKAKKIISELEKDGFRNAKII